MPDFIFTQTAPVKSDGREILFSPSLFTSPTIAVAWIDPRKLVADKKDIPILLTPGMPNLTPALAAYRSERLLANSAVCPIEFPFVLSEWKEKFRFTYMDAHILKWCIDQGVAALPVMGDLHVVKKFYASYGIEAAAPDTVKDWREYVTSEDPIRPGDGKTITANIDTVLEAVRSQMNMFCTIKVDIDRAERAAEELKTPEVVSLLEEMERRKTSTLMRHPMDYEAARNSQAFVAFYRAAETARSYRERLKPYAHFPEAVSGLVGTIVNGTEWLEVANLYDASQIYAACQKSQQLLPANIDDTNQESAWRLVDSFNRLLRLQPRDEQLQPAGLGLEVGNGFELAQKAVAQKIAANPFGREVAQKALVQAHLDVLGQLIGEPLRAVAANDDVKILEAAKSTGPV